MAALLAGITYKVRPQRPGLTGSESGSSSHPVPRHEVAGSPREGNVAAGDSLTGFPPPPGSSASISAPAPTGPQPAPVLNPPNQHNQPDVPRTAAQLAERETIENRIRSNSTARTRRVTAWLATQTVEFRQTLEKGGITVSDVIDGHPQFTGPTNENAAISTNAHRVRGNAAFGNVQGEGITIGVWESGSGPVAHPEWNDRMTWRDGAGVRPTDHAAHVTGTLIASGNTAAPFSAFARGMAPLASVDLYDTTDDLAEMLDAGADTLAQLNAGRLALSNHSYGLLVAWDGRWQTAGFTRPTWFGPTYRPNVIEDSRIGRYSQRTADLDDLCRIRQGYLPFFSAGNSRNHTSPLEGRRVGTTLGLITTYNGATDPPGAGEVENGYDVMADHAIAKNVITVGAIDDALLDLSNLQPPITGGKTRLPSAGTMSVFSSWGPVDDGRVKPDLVANGVSVYSTLNLPGANAVPGDADYASFNGTSMATPNACGSAALLVQRHRQLFPAALLRAATLKGLILHTADDLGNPGPDYQTGWGLMNTEAAATLLQNHAAAAALQQLFEGTFAGPAPTTFTFHWNEAGPLRLTLCYQDRASAPKDQLDDRTPDLVNDLDLELTGPGGRTWLPWRLNPANPAAPATTGDNDVDNVKQIFVANPEPGPYTLTLYADGPLTGGSQAYSLFRSGTSLTAPAIQPVLVNAVTPYAEDFSGGQPFGSSGWSYQSTGDGRIQLTGGGLRMDSASAASPAALNTATLHANLSSFNPASKLFLEVDWRDLADESHTLPATHDGLGMGDGISVSADGTTWHRIGNLHSNTNNTPQALLLDLSTIMPGLGIGYGSNFRIRFSQYGVLPAPGDGISIDAVRLYQGNAGRFAFFSPVLEHGETFASAFIRVDRTQGTDGPVSVSWFVRPLTAVPGTDYQNVSGTLDFADGEASSTLVLPVLDRPGTQGPRVVELVLTNPTNQATLGANRIAQLVIADSGAPSTLFTDPPVLRPAGSGSVVAPQTLRVWNARGYGNNPFTAVSGTPWITVTQLQPGNAFNPALFSVSYNLSGLTRGRHVGAITVSQLNDPFPMIDIPVHLTLGWPGENVTVNHSNGPVTLPAPGGPITGAGPASVWPLTFPIPSGTRRAGAISLGFAGLTHANPAHLDIVIKAPGGETSQILSDAARRIGIGSTALGDLLTDFTTRSVPFSSQEDALGPRLPTSYETGDFDVMPLPAPRTPGRTFADLTGSSIAGSWQVFIHDDTETGTGTLDGAWLSIDTVDLSDGLYQPIKLSNPFTLGGQSILFTPEDSPDGYIAGRLPFPSVPVPPSGFEITPSLNGYTTINLTGGVTIPYYGQSYGTLAIGHKGDIVFGGTPAVGSSVSTTTFFERPRLAALFGSLNRQGGGSIHFQQLGDRAIATWLNVMDLASGVRVSFHVELFYDGRLRMVWGPTGNPVLGTAGLSRGYGSPTFASTPGFSTLPPPPLEVRDIDLTPGGSCSIVWSSVPDMGYTLQWSADLTTWKTLVSVPGGKSTVTTRLFTDPGDGTRLFLRIHKNPGF